MAKYRFDQIAINSTEKKKPVEEDRFTYLGLEHLDSGTLKVTRFGSEVAPIGEKLVMHKGDVLFGKRRAYQKKVAIAPFDGIFSAHGMVLRPKEDVIDKEFFPLFISSDYFLDAAIKISVGSLSPTINWRDLKELEFELPDMDTQRKLAEVLWSINDTMEAYKRLISATDELVKSQFIDMFGVPLLNEKGWPLKRIGDLFSLISRGKQPSYVDHSSVRVVNQACIYWDRFNFENVKYHDPQSGKKTLPIKKDCILINSTGTGTLGRCNVFPELTDGYTYAVDSHVTVLSGSSDVNAYFFKCFLHREDVQKKIYAECVNGSTNQIELSKEKLSDVLLIVPPIDLQEQFAAFVRQSDKSKFVALRCSNLNLSSGLEPQIDTQRTWNM
mgnify:CR=1 FL=1